MNTYEKIKAGAEMGWSAVLEYGSQQYYGAIVWIGLQEVFTSSGYNLTFEDIEKYCKITGWLYAGELLGNTIPEKQKFRVKRTGKIWKYTGKDSWSNAHIELTVKKLVEDFEKSEIEPVF